RRGRPTGARLRRSCSTCRCPSSPSRSSNQATSHRSNSATWRRIPMARFPGGSALVAVLLSVAAGGSAWAQGGWRQWDVVLRNGNRLVANPLGAPDTLSFSRSVGGFETKEDVIPRRRVDYLAAGDPRGPLPPEAIRPAAPIGM